ncbi:tail fiber protein [uncultured Aquimarina sp.]|uniref:tail fiber protein n=1 Tax=uncultured Aquimarina sp. TaxID=575652 RepID=UPI002637A593|nr:tail fiber protein [uncultured Aquimarina sp.]
MKTKLLFLSFLMLFTISASYSQTSASTAGIAVQGIARDNNNTARANASISLTFFIYHKVASTEVQISTETANLETDAFGVFSHVIDPTFQNNANFANFQAYLRITEGPTVISDEQLKHVPYAIAANNGVPSGSIMPFIGTDAPAGWVLCNGQSLTAITGSANLRTLLGSNNAPNLQGMFLRGTGTSPVNNESGPALKGTQQDSFESHNHPDNISIANGGSHTHGYNDRYINDSTSSGDYADGDGTNGTDRARTTGSGGTHNHTVNGGVQDRGDAETRPVNYGVNYIIKL